MNMLIQEAFSGTLEEEALLRKEKYDEFVINMLRDKPVAAYGGPYFKARVRKALDALRGEAAASGGALALPMKTVVESDRIVLDGNLGILYLNRKLGREEIQGILASCADGITDFSLYSLQSLQAIRSSSVHGTLNAIYRRRFRKSLESQVTEDVLKIVKSPPRGKVATEDQHFLLTIMKLEMFMKALCVKVEKHSMIKLLADEQRKLKNRLLSLQKKQLMGTDTSRECAVLRESIAKTDEIIFHKRLVFQSRLINRVFASAAGANRSTREFVVHRKNRHEQIKTDLEIRSLKVALARVETGDPAFARRKLTSMKKRLTALKRKHLKYSYLNACYENQAKFITKLKAYMEKYSQSELIPESFHKSPQTRVFNGLRFFISALFVGLYLYIIRLPLAFAPLLFVLGLYVFQPIANKFAILLMTKFTHNSGLKRLSAPELKTEIDRRAAKGQYLCAVDLPLFTCKAEELYTTEYYIKKNIQNLGNTLSYYGNLGIVYQITSNTADKKIVEKEIEITQRMQEQANFLYGKRRIYFLYLHRSASTAKKVGNILAAHLLKQHGYTYPRVYTDPDRFLTTFDPKPLFDRAFGNFHESLCASGEPEFSLAKNRAIVRSILEGREIPIMNRIEFSFFIDNKNEMKPGSFETALAEMLHPENGDITIIQPQMSIEDPVYEGNFITSAFLRMMRIARDVHNDRYLATLHGLYNNMSAYYGKGMVRLQRYDTMVMNEILNLKYIDSHDWQESVFNHAALAISGDTRIRVVSRPAGEDKSIYAVLVEKGHESIQVTLAFRGDICEIRYPDGNTREIHVEAGAPDAEKITAALDYLDNKVDVGERELISTIGNCLRDSRWLKGDLQMLHTFAAYRSYMPPYHRFHLGNIIRRFANEITLLLWVVLNFALSVLYQPAAAGQGALITLTLYLAVTAFGFAGIDLFIYPIFFEIKNRPVLYPRSAFRAFRDTAADVLKKIAEGLWQFVIYLFIAWPRVYQGIKSSVKVLAAGIDQTIDWGAASNACISAEETSKQGLPLKRFLIHYGDCVAAGLLLTAGLAALVLLHQAFASVFLPFNLGIIAVSLVLAPFVGYLVSKQIRQK